VLLRCKNSYNTYSTNFARKPRKGNRYRVPNPSRISLEELAIDIPSIDIDSEMAIDVVRKWVVTSEYVLVKVEGQWYFAA
jgi:hypothetical protein